MFATLSVQVPKKYIKKNYLECFIWGCSDLYSPVVGVEGELGQAGHLAGEVPALLQAEHHAAALQVHQVRDGARQLHYALQQAQPLAPLHQLQKRLLLRVVALEDENEIREKFRIYWDSVTRFFVLVFFSLNRKKNQHQKSRDIVP